MTSAIKTLVPMTQLAASAASLYTAGANSPNGKTRISGWSFTNTDASQRTYSLHIVPSGGSAVAGNKRYDAVTIPAKTTREYSFFENELVLDAGTQIYVFADSANLVNFFMSGEEVS